MSKFLQYYGKFLFKHPVYIKDTQCDGVAQHYRLEVRHWTSGNLE